jgi:hypothetical protein
MKEDNPISTVWIERKKMPINDLKYQYYRLAQAVLSFAVQESHIRDKKYITDYIKQNADYFLTTKDKGGVYDLCCNIIKMYEENHKPKEKKRFRYIK